MWNCIEWTKGTNNVLTIRTLGIPHAEIAKIYGVSQSTITRIIRRDTWRHI